MNEPMIRTQVYLPREIYDELQARAQARQLTMAVQIREALEEYLKRTGQAETGGILQADDPIFQLTKLIDGPADLAANHDRYLYENALGDIPETAPRPRPIRKKTSTSYGASKSPKKKRRKSKPK